MLTFWNAACKQVIYDYATVQGYSCKKCRTMGQHQLALRPPGYLECVLRAGPQVTSFPDGCGREDDYVVYNDEHKELLMKSGFTPVRVHYFKPDVPLPEGIRNVSASRCPLEFTVICACASICELTLPLAVCAKPHYPCCCDLPAQRVHLHTLRKCHDNAC